ncbi:MAG: patatin-like phospholipase family protein [Sphingobium sp.]|uniref:patatin-like phospholipase family protein n=1 Tax=Sphingobium sp. TaxID=1912891 RepID=UPI0029A1EB69|nr:patatin-like phospholipase family protein [Sphingobium sp.]MDX3911713.1 patatin-like phospholipase family protein [Sphingobium sp.]
MTVTENTSRQYCDLIMKGGITSGVVYPKMITTLAKKYNFRNIGGASAGAIAAGVAAAAEYARIMGRSGEGVGMDGVDQLPGLFSKGILGFFQPVPRFRRLFALSRDAIALKDSSTPRGRALFKLIQQHYGRIVPLGTVAAIALTALASGALAWVLLGWSGVLNVVFLALLVSALTVFLGVAKLVRTVFEEVAKGLPENRFGICSGLTENEGEVGTGLTDWLADLLGKTAGLSTDQGPLTFRMLNRVRK